MEGPCPPSLKSGGATGPPGPPPPCSAAYVGATFNLVTSVGLPQFVDTLKDGTL